MLENQIKPNQEIYKQLLGELLLMNTVKFYFKKFNFLKNY